MFPRCILRVLCARGSCFRPSPTHAALLCRCQGVLDAFRMLPEYSKKEGQLQQLEELFPSEAGRHATEGWPSPSRLVMSQLIPPCHACFTACALLLRMLRNHLCASLWLGSFRKCLYIVEYRRITYPLSFGIVGLCFSFMCVCVRVCHICGLGAALW